MVSFNKMETSQNVTTTIFFTKWLNMKDMETTGYHRWKPMGDSGFVGVRVYIIQGPSFVKKKNLITDIKLDVNIYKGKRNHQITNFKEKINTTNAEMKKI